MKFIKHKNMTDVCFLIHDKLPNNQVRGVWVNIAMGEPFLIGDWRGLAIETITIKDPENWSSYNDARAAQTRA